MENKEKIRVAKIHICPFYFKHGCIAVNTTDYPERICVLDEERKIVVDAKTYLQYPYVKVMSQLYLIDNFSREKINLEDRYGCLEYTMLPFDITEELEVNIKNIMYLIGQGYNFRNGNKALTNEEYLKMLENEKNNQNTNLKVKKIGKKRK